MPYKVADQLMSRMPDWIVRLWASTSARISFFVLTFFYIVALLAPFLSPYLPSDQLLAKTYHPPTGLTWKDGGLHVLIYRCSDRTSATYNPDGGRTTPLYFFCKGGRYDVVGSLQWDRHLFGVESGERVYFLGSDSTGRDVFTRLLYGARVSLSIGLIGVGVSLMLGMIIGGFSGYLGGWIDSTAMRTTEVLMAIPGLYLLLSLRAALSKQFTEHPEQVYLFIVIIMSAIGWSGTARVVRGLALSLRARPFVMAAEAMGQSRWRIVTRHLLPNAASYLIVAATLSVPGYILGEAALSFLGIGIQEPGSSWGLMLSQAQEMKVFMLGFWWMLTPGAAIFVTVVAFNVLGDALRDAVDPKFKTS